MPHTTPRPERKSRPSAADLLGAVALILAPLCLSADDLFIIEANGSRGSGSSLPDLIQDFLLARGQFSELEGQPAYNAELTYAGVANAIEMDVGTTGLEVVLRIPTTGFERTFTGTSREDVENQIEDFVKDDGAREWGRFNREMAKRSLVAVTDGNPNSTTAHAANSMFQEFGRRPGRTQLDRSIGRAAGSRIGFSLIPAYSQFEAGDFGGEVYSLRFAFKAKFTERIGLVLLAPANYVRVEGAEVYHLGATAGLPLTLIPDRGRDPLYWKVTPSAGIIGSGSADFAAGGLVEHYAVTSLLAYQLGNFTLSMGNQYGTYRGRNSSYRDFDIRTDLDQRIIKNGLTLSVPFGYRWVMDVYVEETRFRKEAAINRYRGVGGDLVFRLPGPWGVGRGYLTAGGGYDFGDDYSAIKGRAGFGWRF